MSLFEDPEIYRTVLESMRNGIYLVDRSEKIRFWNEGAEKITGYLRQDVLGHCCRDFFAQQEQEGKNGICELGGALAAVLRDGRPVVSELTLRHKYYQFLRMMIVAFMKGTAPSMQKLPTPKHRREDSIGLSLSSDAAIPVPH